MTSSEDLRQGYMAKRTIARGWEVALRKTYRILVQHSLMIPKLMRLNFVLSKALSNV